MLRTDVPVYVIMSEHGDEISSPLERESRIQMVSKHHRLALAFLSPHEIYFRLKLVLTK